MRKMTAFFHLGHLVTADIEKYRENTADNKPLPPDYQVDPIHDPTIKDSAVGLPALQTGNWAWVEGYCDFSSRRSSISMIAQNYVTPSYL